MQSVVVIFEYVIVCHFNIVKENAVMPLSQFMVGAIAVGGSGNLYFGVSQDFCHTTTSQCVHAEQSAVYNAYLHRERKITLIAVNAELCGFCRQFLHEISDSKVTPRVFCRHRQRLSRRVVIRRF